MSSRLVAGTDAPRALRVLHVSQPVEAGVAAVVLGLLVAQRSRGWQPSVACPGDGWLAEQARAHGVVVHPWAAGRAPGPAVPGEALALRRIVRIAAPDVVHLHSSKAGLAGRLAVRGRTPTLYQPHAWSFDAVDGVLGRLSRQWERVASRWTGRLLCVSDDELAAGRAIGIRAPADVIPNGVDVDRFAPRDRGAARARLGLPTDRPLVVCVGRITEQKGQDLLLAAWARVRGRTPDAMLALVGDGPRAAAWRMLTPGSDVMWPGSADPADWYAAADLVALPSRWEGMALVPLEAMASGRPVVGFDVTGVAESIGDAGSVVASGDVDAFADAVTHRIARPEVAAAEGLAGRARVEKHFSAARAADETCRATADIARAGP